MDTIMLAHDALTKEECDSIIKHTPRAQQFYKDSVEFTTSPNDIQRQDTQYDPYFVFQAMMEEGLESMYSKINSILSI